jgi:hypothetical protein
VVPVRFVVGLLVSLTVRPAAMLSLLYGVRNLGFRHRLPKVAGESLTDDWMQVYLSASKQYRSFLTKVYVES